MKTKFTRIIAAAALSIGFILNGFVAGNSAFAIDEDAEYRMDITPTQKNWGTFEPGESYTGSFEIRNEGKQDFDYEVSIAPYSAANENYDADYSKETQYNEIRDWIEVDKSAGSVASGERVNLEYRIQVPEDAHGGAQVGVIMVTMLNSGESSGTGVQALHRLGYLVYGNVDGETTTTGKILENKVFGFLFNPPIRATSIVENTGNIYTVASYKLQVFPLFSDEEVYTNEEEPEENIIFPETKRFVETSWEGAPRLGIFRVKQTVKIFDEESVVEKIVFLCPIWFLFIVSLFIFVVIFWLVSRIIQRRKKA